MSHASAVILLSGGLDSATALACAKRDGFDCYALSFDYGQRHGSELAAAHQVAKAVGVEEHRILSLPMGELGGSALTQADIPVPTNSTDDIPVTYVPARNTVFLSFGLAWGEVLGAAALYIGVNAVDYSGYPDCRPEYIDAFQKVARLATRQAVEGNPIELRAPLLTLSKSEIISLGMTLGVDYSLTTSCYQPDDDGLACGRCDACRLRREGFLAAGVDDPTRYAATGNEFV